MPYITIPAGELKELAASSPLPLHLQEAEVFQYSIASFPFRSCVAEVLGCREEELGVLHQTDMGRAVLSKGEKAGKLKRRKDVFIKLWNSSRNCTPPSTARQRFDNLLDKFVATVIAPLKVEKEEAELKNAKIQEASSTHHRVGPVVYQSAGPNAYQSAGPVAYQKAGPVAYQRDAILRVVLPHGKTTTDLHCDADYHHPPWELNWWVPLTPVSDTNSLYLESSPGRGDFQPVQLEYGQVLRFYGNLCQHYSVPNISPVTRVSFDVRVLSLNHSSSEWRDRQGRECIHKVGQYFVRPSEQGGQEQEQEQEKEQEHEQEEEGELED